MTITDGEWLLTGINITLIVVNLVMWFDYRRNEKRVRQAFQRMLKDD